MDTLSNLFTGFGTAAIVLLVVMIVYSWFHDGADIPAMVLGTVFGVLVSQTWVGDIARRIGITLAEWGTTLCGNFGC